MDALPDVPALLAGAPDREYALLELALNWAALSEAQQRIAARLRLFVITRDPLDWIPNRGAWWATVYANGDVVDELAVYVLLPEVLRRMEVTGDAAGVLAPFAEAAVRTAADLESLVAAGAYPTMVAGGAAPRLLDRLDEACALGPPSVAPCSDRWEPMGLGAIQDLVQEAFGPVDLDRSPVSLAPIAAPDGACPACRGSRFGFPGELTESQGRMCGAHQSAASELISARLARARVSNPAGWRAIGKASARINGLGEPGGLPLPPRSRADPGRNDPCPCGSGRKYKHCCGV